MNTELRKKAENDLKKDFVKLMSNSVFGRTMGYVRKHKDIKLLANKPRKNYQNQTIMQQHFFLKIYQQQKRKKTQVFLNKPVYLGLLILEINKIAMHEFWSDNVEQKYGQKI